MLMLAKLDGEDENNFLSTLSTSLTCIYTVTTNVRGVHAIHCNTCCQMVTLLLNLTTSSGVAHAAISCE